MFFLSAIMFSGCSGSSPEEKLYSNLEKTIEIEEGASGPAAKLNELEKENEEIFKVIIGLGEEDFQSISKEVDKAIKINEERKKELEEESKAINKAKNEFNKSKNIINKLKNDEDKKIAEEMYVVMGERYENFDSLFLEYKKSIDSNIKMYDLLKESEVSEDSIIKKVENTNTHNEKIIDYNKKINEKTDAYNLLKKELYKKMEMNINFSEENE